MNDMDIDEYFESKVFGIVLSDEQKIEFGKVCNELVKAIEKIGYGPFEAIIILELTRQYLQNKHKVNLEIKKMNQ